VPPIERHVRVQRTARYYQLGRIGDVTRELWVACHGYGQLAAPFAKALEPLDGNDRIIVVPEALNRFYLDDPAKRHGPESPVGASWMTREDRDHDIADYVDYLDALVGAVRGEMGGRPIKVIALGFSQGVATVMRWAALGRTQVHRLILWAGTPANDLPTDRQDLFRGASITLVAGRADRLVPVDMMEHEHRRMTERGLTPRLILFDGGHSLNSDTLRELVAGGDT
jgi:predicted esterase